MNSIDVILQLTKGLDHPCPPEGAKLLSAYYALTLEKGKELAAHALEIEDQDTCSVLLLNLALLVPGSLAEIYPQILHRDLFEWEKLFLGAGPDICEAIVQRLKREQDGTKKLLYIEALAWAGTEFAQQILAEMTSQTIQVGSEKILTEEIIPCAGWELTEDGERRDLYFQESCALEFVETPHSNFHTESCPWCGQRLLLPFRFDLSDPRLAFLDMEGNQLHIATCANCVNLSAIYMHLDTHGKAKWSTSNTRPDIVRDDYGPV